MMRRSVLAASLALALTPALAQFATIAPPPPPGDNGDRIATTAWVKANTGTPPGGAPGTIQYNNGGAFGGFTASGDATINTSTGNVTVSKINGATPSTASLSDTATDTAWTPSDASGAGLTLTVASARYVKMGKQVTAAFRLTFPSTANGSNAAIGGLPVAASANYYASGFNAAGQCYTSTSIVVAGILPSASQVSFLNSSGALMTNANLSGLMITCVITYISS